MLLKPLRAMVDTSALMPYVMALCGVDIAAMVDASDVNGRAVVLHRGGCALVAMAPLRCRAGVVWCFRLLVDMAFITWFVLSWHESFHMTVAARVLCALHGLGGGCCGGAFMILAAGLDCAPCQGLEFVLVGFSMAAEL